LTVFSQTGSLSNIRLIDTPIFTPKFTDSTISFPIVQAKPLYFFLEERNHFKKKSLYLDSLYDNSQKLVEKQSLLIDNKQQQYNLLEESYKSSRDEVKFLRKQIVFRNWIVGISVTGFVVGTTAILLSK